MPTIINTKKVTTIDIDPATNQQIMKDVGGREFILSVTGGAEYLDKK